MNRFAGSTQTEAAGGRRRVWAGFVLGTVVATAGMLVWSGLVSPRPAFAQVPDSGKQRAIMIAELQTANKQLGQVVKLLTQIRDQGGGDSQKDGGGKK